MSTWKNLYYTQPYGQEAHLSAEAIEPVVEEPAEVIEPVDQAQVDSILALSPEIVEADATGTDLIGG